MFIGVDTGPEYICAKLKVEWAFKNGAIEF